MCCHKDLFKISRGCCRNRRNAALPGTSQESNGEKHGREADGRAGTAVFAPALLATTGALVKQWSNWPQQLPEMRAQASFHFCWATVSNLLPYTSFSCPSVCADPGRRLGHSRTGILLLGCMMWQFHLPADLWFSSSLVLLPFVSVIN